MPRRVRAAAPGEALRRRREGGLGGDQVEGLRAVRELLVAGRRRVHLVWVARGDTGVESSEPEGAHPDAAGEILRLAAQSRVRVESVEKTALHHAAVTDAPQGVIAWADPLPETSLDEMCAAGPGGSAPFLIVVDGVTDPRNLGALARTGLSAGATGMVLGRHRSAHVTPTATKAAAGAIEYLPIAVVPGIPSALIHLAEMGVWSIGLDPQAELSIFDVDLFCSPVALVLGAEGRGLSRLAARRCDLVVSIPQQGPLGSLNVSAAGAVACFEVARRRSAS